MTKLPIKIKTTKADIINLIAVSVVSMICIAFCVIVWVKFNSSSQVTPNISNLRQLKCTDSSVLISWSCNVAADRYVVGYDMDGETQYFSTEIPFAKIDGQPSGRKFEVKVSPIKNGVSYQSAKTSCYTQERCDVTSIRATLSENGFDIAWEYSGVDMGFDVLAYVVDAYGKRHLTCEKVTVESGKPSECRIEDIICNMVYTIAVVPKTEYFGAKKLSISSDKYSKSYKELKIYKSVISIPLNNTENKIRKQNSLNFGENYCVAIIITGKPQSDLSDIQLYFLNENGIIADTVNYYSTNTNPDNSPYNDVRTISLPFTARVPSGNYNVMVCIDGKPAQIIETNIVENN